MTLITDRIESTAKKIYLDTLHKPGIPEDLGADIYCAFITRMKKYRTSHPEVKKVTNGFVNQCVRWITRNLLAKRKKENRRQELLTKICQEFLPECGIQNNDRFGKEALSKIFAFMEKTCTKKSYAMYGRIFLLYYAYYLPDSFILGAAHILGADKNSIMSQASSLRTQTARRVTEIMQNKMNAASACYFRLLELQANPSALSKQELHITEKRLKQLQAAALEQLSRIKPVPRFTEIADCLGVHRDKVRYGIKTFTTGLTKL